MPQKANKPSKQATAQELEKRESRSITISPANILTAEEKNLDIDIPDFLKEEGAIQREAPEGFSPLIDFADEIGKWIVAQFIGARAEVGPNASMMYEFRVPQEDGKMLQAALWGATILDQKFEMLKPLPLDWIFIQYTGVVQTKRGMKPAKDFRLKVITPSAIDKELKRMGFKTVQPIEKKDD